MEELKIIAKKELEMFGGQPKVIRFFDENEKKNIDTLISLNRLESGLQSCGTIGLSKTDSNLKNDGKYLRIELLVFFSFEVFSLYWGTYTKKDFNITDCCFHGRLADFVDVKSC